MKDNLAKNQPLNTDLSILNNVHLAWLKEDQASFAVLVSQAIGTGITKHDIINYLESKKNEHTQVDEEFETWAYNYIVSGGMGKLRPG